MFILLFIGGILMILLGFIGIYVGFIFQEVKRRPIYLVRQMQEAGAVSGRPAATSAAPAPIPHGEEQ